LSSGQNVAILSGVVLNANIFQTIHRMETEIASVKRGERPLSNNTSFTIFAYNLVTTTQKTEQFTENKTPAQAFTLASVGQITSQVSFVSTSVPSTFLERREVVGFVYFFSWYALRIIQTKKILYKGNLYVLPAKDEEPLTFCSGNTCCAFVLHKENMQIPLI
jgi:hypothetical protein